MLWIFLRQELYQEHGSDPDLNKKQWTNVKALTSLVF